MKEKKFHVVAETGIMSRPATMLVEDANNFLSDIGLVYNGQRVNLKSIMGVMSLGIPQGSEITIQVSGDDENEAFEGIEKHLLSEGLANELSDV